MILRSPFLITASTNLLIAALGIVSSMLSARLLGPPGRGDLAAIQTWPNLLSMIALVGLPQAAIYLTASTRKQSRSVLVSAYALFLVSSLPFMVAGILFMPVVLPAQSSDVVQSARLYLLTVPLLGLSTITDHVLLAHGRPRLSNVVRVVTALVWVGVLVGAVFSGENSAHVLTSIYIIALGTPVALIVGIGFRSTDGSAKPSLTTLAQVGSYALPMSLANCLLLIVSKSDLLVLTSLVEDSASVGAYVVAAAWGAGLHPLLHAFGRNLFTQIAACHEAEDRRRRLRDGLRLAIFLALITTAIWVLVTPYVLPLLFGREFVNAVRLGWILSVASGVVGTNAVIEEAMRGLRQPRTIIASEALGLFAFAVAIVVTGKVESQSLAVCTLCGGLVTCSALLASAARQARASVLSLLLPGPGEVKMLIAFAMSRSSQAGKLGD